MCGHADSATKHLVLRVQERGMRLFILGLLRCAKIY
jgi:hypothetical protein